MNTVVHHTTPLVQDSIRTKGYVVLRDATLGLTPDNRASVNALYTEAVLQNDVPNVYPADRLRARDVVQYTWQGDTLRLEEHPSITLQTPKNTPGNHPHGVVREYKRILVLEKPVFKRIVEQLLRSIPLGERQARGTVGINLFKTFSDVVSGAHQDSVDFVGIYIPDKNCTGSETTLTPVDNPDQVIFRKSLETGDFLVFRDKDYLHNVSPLEPPQDGSPKYRNALILTVDYRNTYDL